MCVELGGVVCSVLDRSEQEEARLHQPRCQTLPLSVYKGMWTHSSPLVAMHFLDRSCVSVGIFLKLHATFPNNNYLSGLTKYVLTSSILPILVAINGYVLYGRCIKHVLVNMPITF